MDVNVSEWSVRRLKCISAYCACNLSIKIEIVTQGLGGWVCIKYNPADNKTGCIVTVDDGKCGHKVGGKNTTNFKRHLKACHKDIFFKGKLQVLLTYNIYIQLARDQFHSKLINE